MKRLLLPLFLKIAKSLGIEEIQNRLDELSVVIPKVNDSHRMASDAFTVAQFSEERARTYADALYGKFNQLHSNLVFHVDQRQIQMTQRAEQSEAITAENVKRLERLLSEFRLNLDALRRSQSTYSQPTSSAPSINNSAANYEIDDVLYLALEDRFRGERDIVAQRQSSYLQYLGPTISERSPLLDLGCGRGEWLSALKLRGIPAVGVDGNGICVTECLEAGLTVQQGDLVSFLKSSEDASFGAITLFQVFEHLPFSILVETMREIRRVLVKDGILIAEIPNSKNIRVGSGTFWIDPTHQRPLFPDVLMFLAEQVGFSQADGIYVNRLGPAHDLSGLPEGARHALMSVLEALDGPGDFALIAKN